MSPGQEAPATDQGGTASVATGAPLWLFVTLTVGMVVALLTLGIVGLFLLVDTVHGRHQTVLEHARVQSQLALVEVALEQYAIGNNGYYPETLGVLVTPDETGASYLSQPADLLDPWGNELRYDPPGPDSPKPRVYSLGADGVPGGTGPDADVGSSGPLSSDER